MVCWGSRVPVSPKLFLSLLDRGGAALNIAWICADTLVGFGYEGASEVVCAGGSRLGLARMEEGRGIFCGRGCIEEAVCLSDVEMKSMIFKRFTLLIQLILCRET